MMCILGVDPGLAATGYGVIHSDGSRFIYKTHGAIITRSQMAVGLRLRQIFETFQGLIEVHRPSAAGIEGLFFAKNRTSGIPVAQARGVILLALELAGVGIYEIQPQEMKRSLTGNGRADKQQIQEMLKLLLGLSEIPKPDHAADALAMAVCCGSMQQFAGKISGSYEV